MTYKPSKVENGRVFLQYSDVAGDPLSASGLRDGELVIQSADGKLYFKSSSGDVENLAFEDASADGNTYGRKDNAWVDLASAAALQFRQGTDAERLAMDPVPASGEPIYTTDTNRFFIGDGTTTGGRGIVTDSDAYVICQPGDDLLAKYTAAKALTPGGNAKSATNRAALIIYPGVYDIDDGQLDIDTDFVDIIGLGSSQWRPSVVVESTASFEIAFGGEDVRVVGLFAAQSEAKAGGTKRHIANCGGANEFYSCTEAAFENSLPVEIEGYLYGCSAGLGYVQTVGYFGGRVGDTNVFTGIVDNCFANRIMFNNTIFQGVMRNSYINTGTFSSFAGAQQGWIQYTKFPLTIPSESDAGWGTSGTPAAFDSTCTISNASPGVVTSNGHQLRSGMRIQLSTTGSLPTGLSTATTYYVKKVDDNTFELAATLNGTSIDTSSAGSGTHTVEVPTGKDGGWFTYCTYESGEYTTT